MRIKRSVVSAPTGAGFCFLLCFWLHLSTPIYSYLHQNVAYEVEIAQLGKITQLDITPHSSA